MRGEMHAAIDGIRNRHLKQQTEPQATLFLPKYTSRNNDYVTMPKGGKDIVVAAHYFTW